MFEKNDYLETIIYKDENDGLASLKVEDYKKDNKHGIIEIYQQQDSIGGSFKSYYRETTIVFSKREAKEILDDLRYFRSFISEYFRNLGQLDHLENDETFGEIIKKTKDLDFYILDYFYLPKVSETKFKEDMNNLRNDNYYLENIARHGKELKVNLLSYFYEKYLLSYQINYDKKCISQLDESGNLIE